MSSDQQWLRQHLTVSKEEEEESNNVAYNGKETVENVLHRRNDNDMNVVMTIDDAIDRIGYGKFQYRILIASGLCSAADAMEILLLSFLSLTVQVEWSLSTYQANTLISVVFAGAFFGTLVLGRMGDVYGRKLAFIITASFVSIFGLLSCFCQTFYQLLLTRFFVGIGIGGITIPFDTYSEFLPTKSRGQNLVVSSYFWTTGTILVAILAYYTLGQQNDDADVVDTESSSSADGRWRLLCFWSSIPCFIATIVGYMYVPESPRWLLVTSSSSPPPTITSSTTNINNYYHNDDANNRNQSIALTILRHAAILNEKDPNILFPPGTRFELSSSSPSSSSSVATQASNASNILHLLSPEWYKKTISLWIIWGLYACLYYGTILSVTLVFSNSTMNTSSSSNSNDNSNSTNTDETNTTNHVHFDYSAIIFSAMAETAGATFVLLTIDKYGRKIMHISCFCIGGCMVLTLCLLAPHLHNDDDDDDDDDDDTGKASIRLWLVLISFLSRMFIFCGSSITWTWTAELLTTELRTTGHSLANSVARVGGFLSPYLVSKSTPYYVIGTSMFTFCLIIITCAWQLPETAGTPLGSRGSGSTGSSIIDGSNDGTGDYSDADGTGDVCTSTPTNDDGDDNHIGFNNVLDKQEEQQQQQHPQQMSHHDDHRRRRQQQQSVARDRSGYTAVP